jgi:hypothetical protein
MTELTPTQILGAIREGLHEASRLVASSERRVFLFGTRHTLQIWPENAPPDGPAALARQLEKIIAKHGIREIAKEMNAEALGGRKSVCSEIAAARGLKHLLCDPNHERRRELGIVADTPRDREKREAEWLRRLVDQPLNPVLFVCGANHVESFAELCRDHGWYVAVIEKDWEPVGIPLERVVI